jgi:uncharacterized protein YdhG (YjbR/CyaY superfamily)
MATVQEYIAACSPVQRKRLREMRKIVRAAAPKAQEEISYGMPAYRMGGVLVYFAAFKNHIGLYPTSSGIRHFKKELGPYVHSKGAIRFPIDRPIPATLITRIVRFRLREEAMKLKR